MIKITPTISIDEKNIQERFIHACGPGGQNVNKVATAVQLRFNVSAASLPEDMYHRLVTLAGKKLSTSGVLTIEARRFRTQLRNREDAREKLTHLLKKATKAQTPRKQTKPTKASKKRRLETKQQRGKLKSARSKNFSSIES